MAQASKEYHREYAKRRRALKGTAVRVANAAYWRERRRKDPVARIKNNMRNRLNKAFRRGRMPTVHLLGCTYQELCAQLEKQFSPGMSWENYGLWHVDHRVPLASATSEEEVLRLCHFSNLQPLWASLNQSKGGRIG